MASPGSSSGDGAKPKRVPVGVGAMVTQVRGGTKMCLVGLRKGSHGSGLWALPGGYLDYGEGIEECAVREVLEETGIDVKALGASARTLAVRPAVNLFAGPDGSVKTHTVSVYATIELSASDAVEAKLMEPGKCVEWRWVEIGRVPRPTFPSLEHLCAELADAGFGLDPATTK